MEVTLICREKISGIKRSPTFSDDASRKAPLLKAGSSEMEIFSAEAPPLQMEAESLPICTGRFNDAPSFFSRSGRNESTLMKSGTSTTARTNTPTTTPAIISRRFIRKMLPELQTCGLDLAVGGKDDEGALFPAIRCKREAQGWECSESVILLKIGGDLSLQLGVAAVDGVAQGRLNGLSFAQPLENPGHIRHAVSIADVFRAGQAFRIRHGGFSSTIRREAAFEVVERDLVSRNVERGQAPAIGRGGEALLHLGNALIQPLRDPPVGDLVNKRMSELVAQDAGQLRADGLKPGDGNTDLAVIERRRPRRSLGHVDVGFIRI